jgi:uncharacterized alpha-E superfamily protein
MLSRVADSIYWMSRYVERVENVARMLDVYYNLHLDLPGIQDEDERWDPLVIITGDEPIFDSIYDAPTRKNVVHFLAFDAQNPNSILSCISAARENARTIREIIPPELWEHLNTFYLMVRKAARTRRAKETPHRFFTQVKLASQLFIGLTVTGMPHGEEWHFCRLGRLLERADKTARILDIKTYLPEPHSPPRQASDDAIEAIQWGALLRSAGGWEAYRRRHGKIEPELATKFLILDADFPRSVLHCLNRVVDSLHAISGAPRNAATNAAESLTKSWIAELTTGVAEDALRSGLHAFLYELIGGLNQIGTAISGKYFAVETSHDSSGQQ